MLGYGGVVVGEIQFLVHDHYGGDGEEDADDDGDEDEPVLGGGEVVDFGEGVGEGGEEGEEDTEAGCGVSVGIGRGV